MIPPEEPSAVCVIPARVESNRFPGKITKPIQGKPLIWHVWRNCLTSGLLTVIATDSEEVAELAEKFGAKCQMTSRECKNGTERAAKLLDVLDNSVIVIVQADMFGFDPTLVDTVATTVAKSSDCCVSAAYTSSNLDEREDSNCVKVTVGDDCIATGFHRVLPPADKAPDHLVHVGMYGYHRELLAKYVEHPRSDAEISQSLEQLRLFDMGVSIRMVSTDVAPHSINCPEDYDRLLKSLE